MQYSLFSTNHVAEWLKYPVEKDEPFLEHLRNAVGDTIEAECDLKFITRQYTEYYSGLGRNTLVLQNYPVYYKPANFSLWVDADKQFGSSSLIDPATYTVDANSGIIELYSGIFPLGIKNIKVTYWAGFSRFQVVLNQNDFLDVTDSGGTAAIQITEGIYNAEDLKTEIETKLNANVTLAGVYTVFYSCETTLWRISSNINFTINWKSGANKHKNIGKTLGFNINNNTESILEHWSNGASGLNGDIIIAGQKLAHLFFQSSNKGDGMEHLVKKTSGGSGMASITFEYIKEAMPDDIKGLLKNIKRAYF